MQFKIAIVAVTLFSAVGFGQDEWWMRQPIRWVQTNLRETDAALDRS